MRYVKSGIKEPLRDLRGAGHPASCKAVRVRPVERYPIAPSGPTVPSQDRVKRSRHECFGFVSRGRGSPESKWAERAKKSPIPKKREKRR